jgi:hypothetical protein
VAYYVRAFCAKGDPPLLRDMLAFVRNQGASLTLDPATGSTDLDDTTWTRVGLLYEDGRLPIILEANRRDSADSLADEEIEEFLEFLEDAPGSAGRKKVESHLRRTRFVVATQLPTSDINDAGYDANGWVLRSFHEYSDGMVQADGEGFYDGDQLIVALS